MRSQARRPHQSLLPPHRGQSARTFRQTMAPVYEKNTTCRFQSHDVPPASPSEIRRAVNPYLNTGAGRKLMIFYSPKMVGP
jgi:hypothetical protein